MQTLSSSAATSSAAGSSSSSSAARVAAPRTRLVYGAPVSKLVLVVAARAWPRIKRTHRFVELILARQRKTSLTVAALDTNDPMARRSRLPDVPREIWLTILHLVALELYKEEEDRFVFQFHGVSDDELWDQLQDDHDPGFIDRIGRARLELDHFGHCDTCLRSMCEESGMIRTLNAHSRDINDVLSEHGLKLVCHHLVRASTFDWDLVDSDERGRSLIALCDLTSAVGSPLNAPVLMFGAFSPTDAATPVPNLPAGADARFRHLLFDLIPSSGKPSDGRNRAAGSSKGGQQASEASEAPGWKALTAARKQ
ncbi:hypothetical protein JCM3774_006344 [Rhodotorula dairenensis]